VALIVTSDKVYRNDETGLPFRETDPLGGSDPYSASKASAEILTASYRKSFGEEPCVIATARAGNVIGGGDWSEDRLIPDMIRALLVQKPVALRYPAAVRPWQHVLDVNAGYLCFIENLATAPGSTPRACNFGPSDDNPPSVRDLVEALAQMLSAETPGWMMAPGHHPPEASLLRLDCSLAESVLRWRSRLSCTDAISWSADWYGQWSQGGQALALAHAQIDRYLELAL
jgi:CDP-glucose 4,6-dehydratase